MADEKTLTIQQLLTVEKGYVHFLRRPAKMGNDEILWIPRVYIKNALVDPGSEYRVYTLRSSRSTPEVQSTNLDSEQIKSLLTIENGFVSFSRKPAKMGLDYIFWVPRVYIKNGLVDNSEELHVYLVKITSKTPSTRVAKPDHW